MGAPPSFIFSLGSLCPFCGGIDGLTPARQFESATATRVAGQFDEARLGKRTTGNVTESVTGIPPNFCTKKSTLWLFNIAMENGPFIDGLAKVYLLKMRIFHGYVK